MEEVYKSDFMIGYYCPQNRYSELIWLTASNKMTDEEYKQELLNYVDSVIDLDRIGHITDKRECYFSVHPQLQIWVNEYVLAPYLERGLSKFAIVEGDDLITNLASQQIMEEEVGLNFETEYFETIEDARKWLTSFT